MLQKDYRNSADSKIFRRSVLRRTMLESLLKKRRKAKSSLNLTLFWISNHGTMRRLLTNSKNASDQSPWTDSFGVPENSLQSGKNLFIISRDR